MAKVLPFFLQGTVVKGFGRGSKDLGCPTANFALEVVRTLPRGLQPGVYCGFASVEGGAVHKMVANIGWCPFYQNKEMSVETHVMHKFDNDFYGSNLKIVLVAYLRGEKNFGSLDELVVAIKADIDNASKMLDESSARDLKNHEFFNNVTAKLEVSYQQTSQFLGNGQSYYDVSLMVKSDDIKLKWLIDLRMEIMERNKYDIIFRRLRQAVPVLGSSGNLTLLGLNLIFGTGIQQVFSKPQCSKDKNIDIVEGVFNPESQSADPSMSRLYFANIVFRFTAYFDKIMRGESPYTYKTKDLFNQLLDLDSQQ